MKNRINQKDGAFDYAQSILNGDTNACVSVKKNCETFVDLWRAVESGVITDIRYNNSTLDKFYLVSKGLRHFEGQTRYLGKSIEWQPWQRYFFGNVYGWEVFDPKFFGLPFTVEINGHYYLATFLYEAVLNTIGFIVLVTLLYKTKKRGLVMSCYLMWYGVVRSVIETFRTDQMLIGSLPFSQLTAIIAAVIGFLIDTLLVLFERVLLKWRA